MIIHSLEINIFNNLYNKNNEFGSYIRVVTIKIMKLVIFINANIMLINHIGSNY